MMNDIFSHELIQRWLKIYMDDLLICGRKSDLPKLIARARKILQLCQENDLFVKPDKCDFFVTTVEFLGFMIREGKLKMNPTKLDGIARWPPPENMKQLRSFLEFCNFYRRFYNHELMAIIRSLREWRCYIYGSNFTMIVWTDHHNLTYFTHSQKLTRQQVRWIMELMDYDLKLQHKAGSKMIVTDALSHHADWSKGIDQDNVDVVTLPDALWIKLVDMELQDTVADTQKNDELAQEALRGLTDPSVSPSHWTIVLSGPDSSTRLMFYNGHLYIYNLGLRCQIVSDHHDTLTAGHLGTLTTSRTI